jgi:hypothetical protein
VPPAPPNSGKSVPEPRTALWAFCILLASYAFFWQARDWNSASRLMLTYAIVDRGTIAINGLERQTGDIAYFRGRYYTDKVPGFSLLGVPPYAVAKRVLRLPDHPLDQPGFAYWPADYWVTLATSGLATAMIGSLLVLMARDLGCGPKRSALVGLAYGLATPAYAYATLSYGHQASSLCLIWAFFLLWRPAGSRFPLRAAGAGFLAALASVTEFQVGPVSAILGIYLFGLVIGRRRPVSALVAFAIGAAVPTAVLLVYNLLAFDSPWDMGYFHLIMPRFRGVHSRGNPLGLRRPDWGLVIPLLWGGHRGLLFYAPILALSFPGWVVLAARRFWGVALVSAMACLAIFVVNLSYPEWTGGWTTGPRLLLPLLPFAMLPVAAFMTVAVRWTTGLAVALSLGGALLMLLFLGVGARIPESIADPLRQIVWPLWRGDPVPVWWTGQRFARNLVSLRIPKDLGALPDGRLCVQFLPLVVFQIVAIARMIMKVGSGRQKVGSGKRETEMNISEDSPKADGADRPAQQARIN